MNYKIPESLAPYLEFIPEDMLAEIISDALRAKIFMEPSKGKQEAPVQSADMNQLLEQIRTIVGNAPVPAVAAKQLIEKAPKEEVAKPVVFETSSIGEDVDDELKSFVEDFAESLFR